MWIVLPLTAVTQFYIWQLNQRSMQDENITQQQSLVIIESMINKAKNQFSENGFAYLLWGWVILFCSVSQFVLQYFLSPALTGETNQAVLNETA